MTNHNRLEAALRHVARVFAAELEAFRDEEDMRICRLQLEALEDAADALEKAGSGPLDEETGQILAKLRRAVAGAE